MDSRALFYLRASDQDRTQMLKRILSRHIFSKCSAIHKVFSALFAFI